MIDILSKTEPITKVLNDFLAPFDCEAKLGADFAYFTESNTINYSLMVPDNGGKAFQKYVEDRFPNIHADLFLWSFLHELGHHETEDDFEDEDWEDYMRLTSMEISNEVYFDLDIEYAATDWAGNYISTHPEEVSELWDNIIAAIKTFYSAVNITE